MAESGDLIGPYRLVSQLGRGAMGEVWRARDERLDRYVALKVLPADQALDIERRARMLREARAAAAIRHGNVVTLFDIVSHKGDDILVMELVEGRTLSDTLRREGPPPLEKALRWIEGIADALAAAHGRGILHRDIKAANIMVTPDGIKVLDFGLAKLRDSEPISVNRKPPPSSIEGVVELSATLPSKSNAIPNGSFEGKDAIDSYRTHVGQLLGTPLYMAPEQVDGALPDEVSEVFSVGVLAHEILSGKPPYSAQSMDELFRQITKDAPPALPDEVPPSVEDIVRRALAKERAKRYPSMVALREAVAFERKRRFAPRTRRWPIVLAAAIAVAALVGAVVLWLAMRSPAERPEDRYVRQALEEYDVFWNEKALTSLRGALAAAPDHPRANAYMILFNGSEPDRQKAFAAATRARENAGEHSKDRALLDAAITLVERGPKAARAALLATGAESDRELGFWTAELDYRAGNYAAANDEYRALLAEPAAELRGRIYDHYSSVLLYLDQPDEALTIGQLYRDAFPGEPDAVGVYATTLSAAGQREKAIAAAEEALRLSEGEDTLAGLAKVVAIAGNHERARELYQRSLEKAGAARRPIRRAALGFLQWIDGDGAIAKQTVAPCLDGPEAATRERGACLFVAGVIEPARADEIAKRLDALAAEATDARPAYGNPAALATLLRARAVFFSGGCVVDPGRPDVAPVRPGAPKEGSFDVPLDFYATYHVPFFATWALCEQVALVARHDRERAVELLRPAAMRAPNRDWLTSRLRELEKQD